jgi:hypothetical protein
LRYARAYRTSGIGKRGLDRCSRIDTGCQIRSTLVIIWLLKVRQLSEVTFFAAQAAEKKYRSIDTGQK